MFDSRSRNDDLKEFGIWEIISKENKKLIGDLDVDTYNHCRRVSLLAKKFNGFIGLSAEDAKLLILGAYFHDIGKALISLDILNKTTALNDEEWKIMKLHPSVIVDFPADLAKIIPIIRYHHERWDGSGYPYGLVEEEIPYLARVVQILDIYDALTHKRSYKRAFTPEESIEIIQEETTKGFYQTSLVEQSIEFFRLL